ncbi:MAG: MerC domain-containing protein [Methylophilaceae bacterium]
MDESVHIWLFCALVPAATLAVWNGFREHGQSLPILFMSTGIALVGSGTFLPMSRTLETTLTVAGSLLLVAGHIINGRLTLIHRIVMQHA